MAILFAITKVGFKVGLRPYQMLLHFHWPLILRVRPRNNAKMSWYAKILDPENTSGDTHSSDWIQTQQLNFHTLARPCEKTSSVTSHVLPLQFDGTYVVSGSLDTSIRVWEVETGTCLHTLMGHQSLTSGMVLRGNILVSGNADSTVKVWDILTGECLKTLEGNVREWNFGRGSGGGGRPFSPQFCTIRKTTSAI